MDLRVGGRYRLDKKIGSGSFGRIYSGTNVDTGDRLAIKLEPVNSKNPRLIYEAKLYRLLQDCKGIPKVHYMGTEGDFNIMVMDLLGPSLEDMLQYCSGRMSLKTVIMVAIQMLTRIETVHERGLVHRDIKPDNFLVDKKSIEEYHITVIDFGLAKKYYDSRTKTHIPFRGNKHLTGTARYASINAHLGYELSRRDDLEALGYVFLYFLLGSLPWQGLQAKSKKEKFKKIAEKKIYIPLEKLCHNLPEELKIYINYARNLKFEEKPDFRYVKGLFTELLAKLKFENDYIFDWTGKDLGSVKRKLAARNNGKDKLREIKYQQEKAQDERRDRGERVERAERAERVDRSDRHNNEEEKDERINHAKK
eukprot:CAMPEP_0115034482 /NCGR_PEP_ID=MMETSP0216-20121206/40681_1 /TAXON_ID=223996 /ORGANISM="Protocruzia adherens, Strain Boccale" /LENGTH=364 /DNA_ID=CAMNT_0002413383 /DNA_START=29 /DNA_END=1123 /DNA_ORIENTATION=+